MAYHWLMTVRVIGLCASDWAYGSKWENGNRDYVCEYADRRTSKQRYVAFQIYQHDSDEFNGMINTTTDTA